MNIPELNPLLIEPILRAALAEDLGRAGDITSQATIPAGTQARAVMAARQPGVVSGVRVAARVFELVDQTLRITALAKDGDALLPGALILRIEGDARAILAAERVALNFASRMSGVASLTALYAREIAHTKAKICCTRKTTPMLRLFEKHAVRCGGGMNHRFGLDDAILIKDNHVAVAGGVRPALRAAKAAAGHLVKIEIEVDTLDQLRDVIDEGADVVLLDNMAPPMLREAVLLVGGRMRTEASGGINLQSVKSVAETGVDLISSGTLTNSAPVLDLGLDIEIG